MAPALDKYSHVTSYSKADKVLGDSNSKVIGNNTELVRRNGSTIVVKLHGHPVVKYNRGGSTQVSSAGYKTSTTKDRINRYTPAGVSVVQRDFQWFLKKNGEKREFRDGMKV